LTSIWCILLNHGMLESRDIVRISECCQWTAWLLCDPMYFWESTFDPESGRSFFYNIRSNESQWEIPGPFREWIYEMNVEDPDMKSLSFILMQHTLQRFTTFVDSEISDSLPAIRAAEEARIEAEDNLESTLEEQANLHDELEKEKTKAARAQEYVRKAMQNFVKKQNDSASKRKDLEAKIATLKKRIEADQEKIKGFAELQGFVDSLNQKQKESERINTELEMKLREASDKIHNLEKQDRTLRDNMKKSQSEVQKKDELVIQLQDELKSLRLELEQARAEKRSNEVMTTTTTSKEIEELREKLKVRDDFVAQLEMETKSERETLREDTAQRCTELETLLAERRGLMSSLNEAKISLEQERSEFKRDRNTEMNESLRIRESLGLELSEMRDLLEQSKEQNCAKDKILENLENNNKSSELRDLLRRSEEEKLQVESREDELRNLLSQSEEEKARLELEIRSREEDELHRNEDEEKKKNIRLSTENRDEIQIELDKTRDLLHHSQEENRQHIENLEVELSKAREESEELMKQVNNSSNKFSVGQRVAARWHGKEDYLYCEILSVHKDYGTYKVQYDNGEVEDQVQEDFIMTYDNSDEMNQLREELEQCLQDKEISNNEIQEATAAHKRRLIFLETKSNEILSEKMTQNSRELLDLRTEMQHKSKELIQARESERAAHKTAASTHLEYMQCEDSLRQKLYAETRKRENDLRRKDYETHTWKESVLSAASDQTAAFTEIENCLREEIVQAETRHSNEIEQLRRTMETKFEKRANKLRESVFKDSNTQLEEIEIMNEDRVRQLRACLDSVRVEMSTAEDKIRSDKMMTALKEKEIRLRDEALEESQRRLRRERDQASDEVRRAQKRLETVQRRRARSGIHLIERALQRRTLRLKRRAWIRWYEGTISSCSNARVAFRRIENLRRKYQFRDVWCKWNAFAKRVRLMQRLVLSLRRNLCKMSLEMWRVEATRRTRILNSRRALIMTISHVATQWRTRSLSRALRKYSFSLHFLSMCIHTFSLYIYIHTYTQYTYNTTGTWQSLLSYRDDRTKIVSALCRSLAKAWRRNAIQSMYRALYTWRVFVCNRTKPLISKSCQTNRKDNALLVLAKREDQTLRKLRASESIAHAEFKAHMSHAKFVHQEALSESLARQKMLEFKANQRHEMRVAKLESELSRYRESSHRIIADAEQKFVTQERALCEDRESRLWLELADVRAEAIDEEQALRRLRDQYDEKPFSTRIARSNRPSSSSRHRTPHRSSTKKKKHLSRSIVLDDMMIRTNRELFYDEDEESGPPPPSLDANDTIVRRLETHARQTMVEMRKRLVARCQHNEKRERDRCRSAMRVCLGELRSSRSKAKELEEDLLASKHRHRDVLRQERERAQSELERAKREAERAVRRARDDALRTVMIERKRASEASRAAKEKYEEVTKSKLREYREHLQVAMQSAAEQVESLRYELDDAVVSSKYSSSSPQHLRLTDAPWKELDDDDDDEKEEEEDDRSTSYIHHSHHHNPNHHHVNATPASRAALRLYRHISAAETYNGDYNDGG